jgi:hypothetical protein
LPPENRAIPHIISGQLANAIAPIGSVVTGLSIASAAGPMTYPGTCTGCRSLDRTGRSQLNDAGNLCWLELHACFRNPNVDNCVKAHRVSAPVSEVFLVQNICRRHGLRGLVLASSLLAGAAGQAATPLPRVLGLAAADNKAFIAKGTQGEVYHLVALQSPQKNRPAAQKNGGSPARLVIASKQDIPAAAEAADVAGRYSILRDGGKDTGCMLTLDTHMRGVGGAKASLAPGCRDQGIVIFDPVGWQIVNGRLALTARKGHKTHLDAQPDGTWKKDPKEGKSLSWKKL